MTRAGGGGGSGRTGDHGKTISNGSGGSGQANAGGGGNAGSGGDAGNAGTVILRYPNTVTISFDSGELTGTTATDGTDKVTSFTAGSGNVSWS